MGSGRHPRRSPEPVGVNLRKYRPRASHMDVVRVIFGDFVCSHRSLVWLHQKPRIHYTYPQELFNNPRFESPTTRQQTSVQSQRGGEASPPAPSRNLGAPPPRPPGRIRGNPGGPWGPLGSPKGPRPRRIKFPPILPGGLGGGALQVSERCGGAKHPRSGDFPVEW